MTRIRLDPMDALEVGRALDRCSAGISEPGARTVAKLVAHRLIVTQGAVEIRTDVPPEFETALVERRKTS